jgi:hypothetical protein
MNTYGEPDVGNLLVRFDEDLREKRVASLSGYSTVKIYIHLIDKLPHKSRKTHTRSY